MDGMFRLARASRQRRQYGERDRGAALVEFAFVAVLLFFLLFGIIIFGVLMSFKQNLVAAAADGARAAAVVVPGSDLDANGVDDRIDVGSAALERAINAYDRSCHDADDGLTCSVTIDPCVENPAKDCITVDVVYENNGDTAMFPSIPLMSSVVPEQLEAESIVESR